MTCDPGNEPGNIWLRHDRPARGPAPAHSLEQIAKAAVRIADADGLDAVSMRKVASAIGAGTMTLYRYVPGKDELYELMIDEILGEGGLPTRTGDWQEDLKVALRGMRTAHLTHPWLGRASAGRPSFGPNMLRAFEYVMSILDDLGLGPNETFETFAMLNAWAYGFVQNEITEAETLKRAGKSREEWQQSLTPYILHIMETGNYPHFTRIIQEAKHRGDQEQFERGLDLMIDGIEARLISGKAGRSRPSSSC